MAIEKGSVNCEHYEVIGPRQKILVVNLDPGKAPYERIANSMFGDRGAINNIDVVEIMTVDGYKNPILPFPETWLDQYRGLVITGSKYTTYPKKVEGGRQIAWWKYAMFKLIRHAEELEMPVLGVCAGAELIAQAMGGEVGAVRDKNGDKFWEVGWRKVRKGAGAHDEPILAGLPDSFFAAQNHEHIATRIPNGKVLLVNRHGLQLFRTGNIYGITFHPEKDIEKMRVQMTSDKYRK